MAQQARSPLGERPVLVHPDAARDLGGESPSAAKGPPAEKKVPDIVRAACRFAAARGRPAAAFLLAEDNLSADTHDVPITKRTVVQLANALADDRFDDLDLVIRSSGGDIHSAYQMMSLLRGRMSGRGELVACVPGKAQSSATLLCLGTDRILLGELGALGPLDAQIRIGVTDVGTPDYTSALHLLKGLNRLQRFSLETFDEAAVSLYEHKVSRNEDILKYSIEFSRSITAPLFERIESQNIGYWDQMLLTGEAYGKRLMERGKLIRDDVDLSRPDHIDWVLHKLVFDYPSHDTVIDRDELVNVLDLRAEVMEPGLQPRAREFAPCGAETLIALIYPPGMETAISGTDMMSIADWKALDTDDNAREVSWENGEGRFSIRVGLYRQKILVRNPWRESARRLAETSAATEYSVREDPGHLGGKVESWESPW